MRWLAKLQMFMWSLFRRRQMEADLADELRDHLALEIESNIHAGMSPKDASFAARRLTGSIALYTDQCRDTRATALIETCSRDVRYALQMLRRTPLFTAAAILTLALGIGAVTTIFTFVENIVLSSLPVQNPQQLVSLNWGGAMNMSYPNFSDFRDRNTSFSSLFACRMNLVNISLKARENFLVWGYEATGNYFATLGIHPLVGRFFTPDEDRIPGANPVMVISHRYWGNHFASDPNIPGRTVKVNGYPFTIIGVAPPSFSGTELIMAADFWVPMSMEFQIEPGDDWFHSRTANNIWALGRLKSDVSREQAAADLNRIARQLAGEHPTELNGKAIFHLARPGLIGEGLRRPLTAFSAVLMGIAAAGLLLACINLAGMLLARASDRQREIGIRLALGASKFQLFRQLMTESVLLATVGGSLGFLIALEACQLLTSWHLPLDLPVRAALRPDAAILCFTATLAVTTTILFGLVPALQAVRADLVPSLKNEPVSASLRQWTVRDFLVISQIALSVVLVICSGLVLRSLGGALALNLGFNPSHAVSVSFDLRLKSYNKESSQRFNADLIEKVSSLSGMDSVGLINNLPLRLDHGNNNIISRADRPLPPPVDRRAAVIYTISPGYLKAAGTKLLSGRNLNSHDREGTHPVAIVNTALTHLLFGNENPIGQHVRLSMDASDKGVEIVGVVETGKYEYLGEDPHPAVFLAIAQTGSDWTTLVARTSLPPQTATNLLSKAVLDLNPELSISSAGSLNDQLAVPLLPARIAATVLGIFGALALFLAATGLFALMAYAVSRRTREIGIRMALGARSTQVLSSLFGRTLFLCAAGMAIGMIITLFAGPLLSAVLYGVTAHDPTTYATAVLLITGVALLASWHPAARAIHIDPARTLREE